MHEYTFLFSENFLFLSYIFGKRKAIKKIQYILTNFSEDTNCPEKLYKYKTHE